MSVLSQLRLPIIAAPMAGGPSTPALVDALSNAGGLGFLAAGYLSAEALEKQMRAVSATVYGVNLFYPQAPVTDFSAVDAYAAELQPLFDEYGLEVPDYRAVDSSDAFAQKMDVVCALRPAVASCTFGLFTADEVVRLHERGIEVWMTVTNPTDAAEAVSRGADVLVVQGPESGGHRSTRTVDETPDDRSLLQLLNAIDVNLPLVAAGGLSTPEAVRDALNAGAVAASCGTAFLLSDEAGTSSAARKLVAGATKTATTRAFSGRVARAVATDFLREHRDAPAVYPHVNTLMKPLKNLANTTAFTAAWAGEQVSFVKEGGAESIAKWLVDGRR